MIKVASIRYTSVERRCFMLSAETILDITKASFAMEGMYATENDEKNIIDVLTGERSMEDIIKEIKQKYSVEKE